MNSSVLQSSSRFFSLHNLYKRFSLFGTTTHTPLFPQFKSVSLEDKPLFDSFMQHHECYSDFNFNSFYSWNTHNEHAFTILHNNLVLRLSDYITGRPQLSLIGTNRIDESFELLLAFSQQQFGHDELKLIPKHTITSLTQAHRYSIIEDPANHDYIISIPLLAALKGRQFKSKRHAATRCEKSGVIRIEDHSQNPAIVPAVLEAARLIAAEKEVAPEENERELMAIARILDCLTAQEALLLTVAMAEQTIVGFSIDELLPQQFVQSHYFKTSRTTPGLAEYFNQNIANRFLHRGYEYWNWEQDLGLESLRRMKKAHRPVRRLKKYTVTSA